MMRFLLSLLLAFAGVARAESDLQLQFEIVPGATLQVGEPFAFRATVTNQGPDASANFAVFTSPLIGLPPPVSVSCFHIIVGISTTSGHGYAVDMEFASLQPGESRTCEVSFAGLRAPRVEPIYGRIYASLDPNSANDIVHIVLQVYATATAIPALTALGLLAMLMTVGLVGGAAARRVSLQAT